MTLVRMDNVLVVVDDLDASIAFFVELGMQLEGRVPIVGRWLDGVIGIDDTRAEIAVLRSPDGHGRLELGKFHTPAARAQPHVGAVNTLGMYRVMFAVDDIGDVLTRLRTHGAELVGEVVRHENSLLCYVRGPEGILLALAESLP